MSSRGTGTDFFISHAGRDTAWAEWLAWQLQQAGYSIELDVWDWAPGEDFVARMSAALERADRLMAVCTETYFASAFGGAELRAAFVREAKAEGRIVPVLVEPVTLPALYAPLICLDLTGLDESAAAARLRARLAGGRPTSAPRFPRAGSAPTDKPGFAGRLPGVWKVPPRSPRFIGRDGILTELRRRLGSGEPTLVVQALYGLGGVGKTQLAIEYAHRFAADYDLVWWIDAEQPVLIPEQLARLAERLDLPLGPTVADTVERLLTELTRRSHWLLIFDNAEGPHDIAGYQPGPAGHVLATSRSPGWGALGGRVEVDILDRTETVTLLRARIPALAEDLADQLAAELGDLPLAAAQAAAYLEQTALPAEDYLRRFRSRRATLLARGDVVGYHGRVDTAWALSLDRLRTEDPAAVQLLELAAFLAPEPIPLGLFTAHPELLEQPLRSAAADPDTLDDSVGAVVGFSLARRYPDAVQLHRLVQAVIRQQLPPARQQETADRVVALLATAHPGDPTDSGHWDAYARLAPHVLATSTWGDEHPASRQLMLAVVSYLNTRGDNRTSRRIAEELLVRWRQRLGPDHPDTLTLAANLTSALADLTDYDAACTLGQDTLDRCRRVLGPEHPTTLRSAAHLTFALAWLGEVDHARALGQESLNRCRRALGDDHPTTLALAATLTMALAWLGDTGQARIRARETLERCRRVLGPDHPTTLRSATNLTYALAWLMQADEARALGQNTLARCRRVLGPDHSTTLRCATALALSLAVLHESDQARELARDTLDRSRRALGPDHPTSLLAAGTLAYAIVEHGASDEAADLGQDTVERSGRVLDSDHPVTLIAATALTLALTCRGEADQARKLGQDTLERCQRVLGPDHVATLTLVAIHLQALPWLHETGRARCLSQDALERSRGILGPDHFTTLNLAAALTFTLVVAGDPERAHVLGQDTLPRCRRVLGWDHPATLLAAASLACVLPQGGEVREAHALSLDTLARCRRIQGIDYPTTLVSASAMVLALAGLGEMQEATALGRDTSQRSRRIFGPDNPVTRILSLHMDETILQDDGQTA